MRILELNFERTWRGGERQTLYNMLGFRKAGIHTELLCRKGSALEAKARQEGFTVYSVGSVIGIISFLLGRVKKYNVLHAQTSHILTYCVFTKWFHHTPVLFTRRVNSTPRGFFTRLKYSHTDKLVAISNEIKNTITSFCGRNDITVISDIVVEENNAATELKNNYPGKYIIGTTSALTQEKDPLTMVEVVKKLSLQRNDFVFLHFGDGNLAEMMRKKIAGYHLQEVYQLMGFVDNASRLVPSFDIFVMTSQQEGLGSSVLDAFINKVPVVSTDAGGLKELLENERGIACNIGDSDAIAEGINTMLNDNQLKIKYADNAFHYVQQYHSMDHITQQYIHLINK